MTSTVQHHVLVCHTENGFTVDYKSLQKHTSNNLNINRIPYALENMSNIVIHFVLLIEV